MHGKNRLSLSFFIASILFAVTFCMGSHAHAATEVSISPTSLDVTPGKLVKVTVMVNPQDEKVYTVRAPLLFDPTFLQVETWKYMDDWMPLRQPGYDSFSNTEGNITRTAGYPGGVAEKKVLGTLTLRAVRSGTTHISLSDNLLALNADNNNQAIAGEPISVNIRETAPKPPTPAEGKATSTALKVVTETPLTPSVDTTTTPPRIQPETPAPQGNVSDARKFDIEHGNPRDLVLLTIISFATFGGMLLLLMWIIRSKRSS